MDIMKDLYRGLIKPMEDFGYSTDQIYLELVADTEDRRWSVGWPG